MDEIRAEEGMDPEEDQAQVTPASAEPLLPLGLPDALTTAKAKPSPQSDHSGEPAPQGPAPGERTLTSLFDRLAEDEGLYAALSAEDETFAGPPPQFPESVFTDREGVPVDASPRRPTRSDARLNRERILAVARTALAESNDVSLTAIAKQAGIGIGTLYRHFPNRESLILALYRQELQKLIDLVPELLESSPPLVALRRWFEEIARYGRLKFGFAEVIHAATSGGADDEHYRPFVAAIAQLLEAGAADGVLKPGLDPEDVLLQLGVLWRIDPATGGEARAARILDLIVDGLRVSAPPR